MTCSNLQLPLRALGNSDDLIRQRIQWVMAGCTSERSRFERRCDRRIAYPYPVRLTPVNARGTCDDETAFSVIGKHLAERGLDFYHSQPLPFRRVLASLYCGSDERVDLLLELNWCRFCQHGWYESGGQFAAGAVDR